MKRIVRLTESDLTRIIRRVINENLDEYTKLIDQIETKIYSLLDEFSQIDPDAANHVKGMKDQIGQNLTKLRTPKRLIGLSSSFLNLPCFLTNGCGKLKGKKVFYVPFNKDDIYNMIQNIGSAEKNLKIGIKGAKNFLKALNDIKRI
jgi:hypothetical protein